MRHSDDLTAASLLCAADVVRCGLAAGGMRRWAAVGCVHEGARARCLAGRACATWPALGRAPALAVASQPSQLWGCRLLAAPACCRQANRAGIASCKPHGTRRSVRGRHIHAALRCIMRCSVQGMGCFAQARRCLRAPAQHSTALAFLGHMRGYAGGEGVLLLQCRGGRQRTSRRPDRMA